MTNVCFLGSATIRGNRSATPVSLPTFRLTRSQYNSYGSQEDHPYHTAPIAIPIAIPTPPDSPSSTNPNNIDDFAIFHVDQTSSTTLVQTVPSPPYTSPQLTADINNNDNSQTRNCPWYNVA
jgi:hypothetical protein